MRIPAGEFTGSMPKSCYLNGLARSLLFALHLRKGIVVDFVSEVLNVKQDDIEDTPAFGVKLNTDFILGMAKIGGGVKILLEIDRVPGTQQFSLY
jgi:chemotaxis signal transduction protein